MVNSAVVILHKTDAMLNVRDVLRCRVENGIDVIVSHEVSEWLKFGVHMEMCDGESCGIANVKGLVKCFAKRRDGLVIEGTNGAKFNVFR